MAQENVEIVKSIFRGWAEAEVDGMLPFFHEDIEYRPTEERGSIHGHDALRRYFDRWLENWEDFQVGPTEFEGFGDSVFNGAEMSARGRQSGVETRMKYWMVWRFRDGKVARWEEYQNRAEALEAVGLSEQDARADS